MPEGSQSVVDIEGLIQAWAWDMFDRTKTKDQAKIPKDYLEMTVDYKRVKFMNDPPEFTEEQRAGVPKAKILFKTHFVNNTDQTQEYSFKTERSTTSVCELEIENGYTLGQEVNITLKTPCEVFEANAGFSREISVNRAENHAIEETLTWGVDSNIKVPKHFKTIAELVVSESQYSGRFKMRNRMEGKVHVSITNKRDNNSFLRSIDGNIAEIIRREVENGLHGFKVEGRTVTCNTVGICKFHFAVEQRIKLTEMAIEEEDL
ncbi:unnamed protein product [Owenia fusiformis]|uniref:Uncharacterized protein n=1 Tax=Owenia fusiformis TaxID=6347 RepID=A0A8J1XJU7_OWEFU|nr:unnamed protein product [Owenia fusiformis]